MKPSLVEIGRWRQKRGIMTESAAERLLKDLRDTWKHVLGTEVARSSETAGSLIEAAVNDLGVVFVEGLEARGISVSVGPRARVVRGDAFIELLYPDICSDIERERAVRTANSGVCQLLWTGRTETAPTLLRELDFLKTSFRETCWRVLPVDSERWPDRFVHAPNSVEEHDVQLAAYLALADRTRDQCTP